MYGMFLCDLCQVVAVALCCSDSVQVNPAQGLVVVTTSATVVPRPPGAVDNLLRGELNQFARLSRHKGNGQSVRRRHTGQVFI